MRSCRRGEKARSCLCLLLAITTGLPIPTRGGELFTKAKDYWHNHQGVPTAEALAVEIKCLEKHIDCYGTIVAKQPDVWGQARMMKHRQDFERQIGTRLNKFEATLQASMSRTDQAFLASAFSLSAAISGAPAVQLPQTASTSQNIVQRQRALLRAQGVANPTTEQLQAAGTQTVINPPGSNPAASLVNDFDTEGVLQRRDLTEVGTGVNKFITDTISLEPTEFLDQMGRYLNHLNELRRINEGDDTADSPGYGLHLVRIPVSILPGSLTRKGYGAEITVTATPYLGRDLLPTTFRNLVTNDIVSQTSTSLTEFFNSKTSLDRFKELRGRLLKAADEAARETAAKKAASSKKADTSGTSGSLGRVAGTPRGSMVAVRPERRRDVAVRRSAQQDTMLEPIPQGSTSDDYKDAYSRALVKQFTGTPLGQRAGLDAPPAESEAVPESDTASQAAREESRKKENATKTEIWADMARNAALVNSSSVPALRSRNARYAFPATQMGEVYGGELILPVALQTFDGVLRKRLEDDPGRTFVVQYQRVAGFIQDQVLAAYDLLARPEAVPLWTRYATPELATAVRARDDATIANLRENFLAELPNCGIDPSRTYGPDMRTTTAAFAWAILVESVLLNERLIQDIKETASAKGMALPPADGLPFFLPCPPDEARNAFNDYVRIRFPIHVFALDPVNQEQNIADQLARTRELQLALSLAFVTGNISAGSMTRFARRMELRAETIALNRTQVAFSHGEDVFGWRFQPRYQTPPTQNNLLAFGQTLVGGPTRDGDRRQLELEPGMRECVALVIMPNFVPNVTFETRTNWYRLNSPKHSVINPLKFLELSRCVQRALNMSQAICDAGLYRSGDITRLMSRVNQLAAELPMQTMMAQVPYENTHGGFELFNVGVTDLGPELRSWYGAPGVSVNNGTSLFLVGDGFSVHQTNVVVGNKNLNTESDVTLLSRQVMRVNVPPGTQPVIRNGDLFVEASIATPYGVSQPLYIPVVDAEPAVAPAAPPASAFMIDPRTQNLKISYTLKDAAGNPHVGNGLVDPGNQRLNIIWSSPTGIAPKKIQVDFAFSYKNVPFTIPLVASQAIQANGQGGFYTIDKKGLDQIAHEYVEQLSRLDDFTIDNPLPQLPTTAILVTPRPLDDNKELDAQPVPMSNALTVVPTPSTRAPEAAPTRASEQAERLMPEPAPAPAPAPSVPLAPPLPPSPGLGRPARPVPAPPARNYPAAPSLAPSAPSRPRGVLTSTFLRLREARDPAVGRASTSAR